MAQKRSTTFTIGCVCCLFVAGLDSSIAELARAKKVGDASLVPRVRFTKEQFKDLVTQIAQLAILLDKSDPQTARVLIKAVNQAQGAFIARDMDSVAELLSRGLAGSAKKTGGAVGVKLREMLGILRRGIVADRDPQIDKMKEFRDEIDILIGKERDLERMSRSADSKLADELMRRTKERAEMSMAKQAGDQGELAIDTGKLAKEMETDGPPDMPGHKLVASAAGKMKLAEGNLNQGQSPQANENQRSALEDLRIVRGLLDAKIKELGGSRQLDTLVTIDAELRKILNTQKTISKATKKIDSTHEPGKAFVRAEDVELARLAREEGKLADQIDAIRKKLLVEGTTAVFPEVLGEVGEDIRGVDRLLIDKKPGKLTQGIQGDIELAIQDMIDAISKEMSDRTHKDLDRTNPAPPPPPDGRNPPPPLVSNLAELKMLYRLQRQIRRRTLVLFKSTPGKNGSKEQITVMHKKLARRQLKVKAMTDKLARKVKAGL